MRRATLRKAIGDLHGPDADVLEFDAVVRPAGRAYALAAAPQVLDFLPPWLRPMVAIPLLMVLALFIVAGVGVLIGCAWALWLIAAAQFA